MKQPIGVFGGTFDPVHKGHVHLASAFLEQLKLAEVRMLPLNKPPHRNLPIASPSQRYQMLQLALGNHAQLKADDCELQRGGTSYTVDTLKHLRDIYVETPLCLVMGNDNFKTLNRWRQWQNLLDYSHIVIATRPGTNDEINDTEIQTFLDRHSTDSIDDLHQQLAGRIHKLELPMLDISSTQIRNKFKTDPNSGSLLPDKVLDFIHSHHLYNT